MSINALKRYIKQSIPRQKQSDLTKTIQNNPQVKTLVKAVMLNHEEFQLLHDNSSYQSYFPTFTQKTSFSNVKPLRKKHQEPYTNNQPVSEVQAFICESDNCFSVYPQLKPIGDLAISNCNQVNLSSNKKNLNKRVNYLFKNLQMESIESSRDIANLTTSIDTSEINKIKIDLKTRQAFTNVVKQQQVKPHVESLLQKSGVEPMCNRKRRETLLKKADTKAKSKSKKSKGKCKCILIAPLTQMNPKSLNHIQMAKMCPCKDHKKMHQEPTSTPKTITGALKKMTQPWENYSSIKTMTILQQSAHMTEFMNKSLNNSSGSKFNDYENIFLKKHSHIYQTLNETK